MVEVKKDLPPRQRQLLRHIARGGTSREFAALYGISYKTTETHRYELMKTIDCHNTAQCTYYAIKFGFIEVSAPSEPYKIP